MKLCSQEGCSKSGVYKHKGKNERYCERHMKPLMYIKHSNKCNHFGCEKDSDYNYDIYDRPLLCVDHKLDGMIPLCKRK